MSATALHERIAWREGASVIGTRSLAEETAVAIVHDGSTAAVMMASPQDLEDFAVGFSLSEGLIDTPDEIRSFEIVEHCSGLEARMWLKPQAARRHSLRRRKLVGPTGCGLCGVDSLEDALRPVRNLSDVTGRFEAGEITAALNALEQAQVLGRVTRSVHAAALWTGNKLIVREDVGRHNALDKLIGACAIAGCRTETGMLLLTSRLSIEMVQKAAVLGSPIVCAMSAPTTLAVETARRAGLTLVAVARADGFEVFTRPDRVGFG